ncbi:unnamed protein product [Leptidea sinapis]|uniref:Uncharacterized protein n=1 Tax=Leptidea sinapis TaxID=189913 RepID=A0A5E4QNM3_9NEOP|nr:unnamed protein product [Leptidea sinapis]
MSRNEADQTKTALYQQLLQEDQEWCTHLLKLIIDGVGYFPAHNDGSRTHCKLVVYKGKSRINCVKCKVHLCVQWQKLFYRFSLVNKVPKMYGLRNKPHLQVILEVVDRYMLICLYMYNVASMICGLNADNKPHLQVILEVVDRYMLIYLYMYNVASMICGLNAELVHYYCKIFTVHKI